MRLPKRFAEEKAISLTLIMIGSLYNPAAYLYDFAIRLNTIPCLNGAIPVDTFVNYGPFRMGIYRIEYIGGVASRYWPR